MSSSQPSCSSDSLTESAGCEGSDVERSQKSGREFYCLAVLDPSKNFLRLATQSEIEQLLERGSGSQDKSCEGGLFQKPGGPCMHCGTTESPQWRRGPPAKPVLCNACGTRYRRTNQFGLVNGASRSEGNSSKGCPRV